MPKMRDPEVVVLCTRNHEAVVVERIAAWRARLPSLRSRVAVLDLGSTDQTVARARGAGADVHSVEGGRVNPLATLDEAIGVFDEPIVIFADASVDPPAAITVLLDAVHDGRSARVHQRSAGAVFVCRRAAWRGQPFAAHAGLLDWAARAAGDPIVGRCTPVFDDAFEVGLVRAALVPPVTPSPGERLQPALGELGRLARGALLRRLG